VCGREGSRLVGCLDYLVWTVGWEADSLGRVVGELWQVRGLPR